MKPIYAFPMFESFMAFVIERHRIWTRRRAGHAAPWTKDKILATYRFCNVYRELDRVTLWITQHWREPHRTDEHLWFAMVIARLVNKPESLAEMAFPGRWNAKHFVDVMQRRRASGQKAFGGAYIVSTGGKAMDKSEYLAQFVLTPMWERRKLLMPKDTDTLRSYHNRLMLANGMGSFMAAQVVADVKYASLLHAKDWWTFAASGPGSRRGMWNVMGHDPKTRSRWKEHEWREALSELQALMAPHLTKEGMPHMHGQDTQNCLCEYHKYRRTQLGTGRPKQKFTPFTGG